MRKTITRAHLDNIAKSAAWHELVYIIHCYRASVQRIDYYANPDDDEDQPKWREKNNDVELGSNSESEELESVTSHLQGWIEKHRQLLGIPADSNGHRETLDFFSKHADQHEHKMPSCEAYLLGWDLFSLMQGKIAIDVTNMPNGDSIIELYINHVLNQRSKGISFIPFSLTECIMIQHIISNRDIFNDALRMDYDDFVCELCELATVNAIDVAIENADKHPPDDIAIDVDSIPHLSFWHIIHNICCDIINDELDNQNPYGLLDDEKASCLNSCAESIRVARKLSEHATSNQLPLSAESWKFITDRLHAVLQHPAYAAILGNIWELSDNGLQNVANLSLVESGHIQDDGDGDNDDTTRNDMILLEIWHRHLSASCAEESFTIREKIKSNMLRATAALKKQATRETR